MSRESVVVCSGRDDRPQTPRHAARPTTVPSSSRLPTSGVEYRPISRCRCKNALRAAANRDSKGTLSAGGIRSVWVRRHARAWPDRLPSSWPLRSPPRCFRIRRSYSRGQRPRDRSVDVEPSTDCSSLASHRRAPRPRLTVRSDADATFNWRRLASIEKLFRSRRARARPIARARRVRLRP